MSISPAGCPAPRERSGLTTGAILRLPRWRPVKEIPTRPQSREASDRGSEADSALHRNRSENHTLEATFGTTTL